MMALLKNRDEAARLKLPNTTHNLDEAAKAIGAEIAAHCTSRTSPKEGTT